WNDRSPVDMYQGVTMSTNHGPSSYEPGFLHNAASASPVYVTPTRVTPMIPALPYLQTPQQSSPASGHSGWAQAGADTVASYSSTGGHHHSPPSVNLRGRDGPGDGELHEPAEHLRWRAGSLRVARSERILSQRVPGLREPEHRRLVDGVALRQLRAAQPPERRSGRCSATPEFR
ncbi:hypothetical protein M9458_041051, partial [Cirrhinus mrigala]